MAAAPEERRTPAPKVWPPAEEARLAPAPDPGTLSAPDGRRGRDPETRPTRADETAPAGPGAPGGAQAASGPEAEPSPPSFRRPGARPARAVIIPHRDDTDRLARCLAALGAEDLTGTEIVVVDNASAVPPAAVLAAHPFARLVSEPRPGAAEARNRGVAETRAPLLLFLDADCVPAPGWLAAAAALPAGQVTAGRVTLFDETPRPRSGAQAFETVFAFRQRAYVAKGFGVTANLAVPRAVFAAVGPFRAGVSEDLDWGRRAAAAGHPPVYDPALAVAHPTRADWPALRAKWHRLTAEGFALRPRGLPARLGWALRAALMGPSVLAHAPRLLRHPALAPAERVQGLATLLRLRLLRGAWMLGQALRGAP